MHQTHTRKEKFAMFVTILWPILLTQIGFTAMNVADTMMSGWYGTADLAGVAVGSSLWMPVLNGFGGILMAVVPIVAQHLGRGEQGTIGFVVTQAFYLSLGLSLFIIVAFAAVLEPVLAFMDMEPDVHHIARHYLIGLLCGIVPLFGAYVLRHFFDSLGHTRVTMFMILLAVPFNILLNDILIFGKLGFPALGGIGAGYATAATYWFIFAVGAVTAVRMKEFRQYRLFRDWHKPSRRAWKELMAIGVPMGLSVFFETSIFSAVTLLIGYMFDTNTIAAHQAAINFSSLTFMIPLSMAMALTIIVAYEVGARRLADARQYTRLGVGTAMAVYGSLAVLLYFFREQVARMYSDDPAVVPLIMQFFVFAVFYQLSDAAQASLQGVLRGYKDTTVPFVTSLIAYWGLGLPIGYALAAFTELGAFGFWVGITVGLTGAALGFFIRLRIVQRKERKALAEG